MLDEKSLITSFERKGLFQVLRHVIGSITWVCKFSDFSTNLQINRIFFKKKGKRKWKREKKTTLQAHNINWKIDMPRQVWRIGSVSKVFLLSSEHPWSMQYMITADSELCQLIDEKKKELCQLYKGLIVQLSMYL